KLPMVGEVRSKRRLTRVDVPESRSNTKASAWGLSTRVSLRFDRTSPTIGSLATTLAGDASSVGFRTSSIGMVEDQVEQHNEGYAVTFPVPE
ncbi:MAG: hypothetical protein AAFX94_20380, partial [Myxococcota bacterium]